MKQVRNTEYSEKLMREVGKKYNKRTLFRMRQFYVIFNDEKVSPLGTLLTWSHYRELLPIKDKNKINYYINICTTHNLSKRELQERIKSKEYERLDKRTLEKLKENNEQSNYDVTSYIKSPIVLKNKYNYEVITEKYLKEIILNEIEVFMRELGSGFAFIGSEYKIKIGERYNYIDLLLFNYKYNCFVVVELKVTELKKEHIGQIEVYMNYVNKNVKDILDNKTIGIIICKKENKLILEYSSDERIIAREYMIV